MKILRIETILQNFSPKIQDSLLIEKAINKPLKASYSTLGMKNDLVSL